jgi:hypothetical protein
MINQPILRHPAGWVFFFSAGRCTFRIAWFGALFLEKSGKMQAAPRPVLHDSFYLLKLQTVTVVSGWFDA